MKAIKGASSSDDNKTVKGRDMLAYGGELMAGATQSGNLFAIVGEFNLWNQRTKPADVSNTNTTGRQINAGPALGISFGRFLFLGKLYAYSRMDLTRKNQAGERIVYTKPSLNSFAFQLGVRLPRRTFIAVEYGQVMYQRRENDGEETKFQDNERMKYSGWGVLYGISF